MRLSARASVFLVGLFVWNAWVWATFVRNVYPGHGFDGFFLVHLVVGAVSVALAGVAGVIGLRGLRAWRRSGRNRGARAGNLER